MIKVLIVDDHEIVRHGLSLLFQAANGFELVGEAQDGLEAIELAVKTQPNIVLMDIKMPVKDGLEASREIKKRLPETKIVVFTALDDEKEVYKAIEIGVEGYVIKNVSSEELLDIIKRVAKGQLFLHPEIANKLISPPLAYSEPEVTCYSPLTPREELVLRLMAQGYKNKEIAAKLFLSEETVKTHVSNILNKLNQTDRLQAVIYALKNQLVTLE